MLGEQRGPPMPERGNGCARELGGPRGGNVGDADDVQP